MQYGYVILPVPERCVDCQFIKIGHFGNICLLKLATMQDENNSHIWLKSDRDNDCPISIITPE